MMDPGLSTSPNQFPDLSLSITGKGLSVKRFIDFKRHPASSDILFMRHLHVALLDHGIVQRGIDFFMAQQPLFVHVSLPEGGVCFPFAAALQTKKKAGSSGPVFGRDLREIR